QAPRSLSETLPISRVQAGSAYPVTRRSSARRTLRWGVEPEVPPPEGIPALVLRIGAGVSGLGDHGTWLACAAPGGTVAVPDAPLRSGVRRRPDDRCVRQGRSAARCP